ncbi:MAG: FecR domain-containing protein [Planctomycetota bacterium]
MSAEHDAEVEDALRAVGSPACRAEFREELRRRFCEGSQLSSPPARRFAAPMIALLAAAAVLAAGYFLTRPSAPAWRVLEVAPGSIVKADGAPLPVEDPDALARGLRNAREIVVEKGELVLQVGDLSLFGLSGGTRVAFAGFDDPDSTRSYEVRANAGRLRARTGPGFAGRRMRVQADVMAVLVTGTAFALDYETEGTCVCCLHGTVEMVSEATGPGSRAVEPDRMCLVFRDQREPLWGGSPDSHAEPLVRLEALALEIWR